MHRFTEGGITVRKNKYSLQIIFSIMILIILISDAKTAANGVKEGIDTCLKVIIPSLFPFFIVTTYLNSMIIGCRLPKIQRFTKQLHIPVGGEFKIGRASCRERV